ncbi:hypothetical protein KIN20_025354 [Parelaphostrongylus tenuis]|uniref:Uncharacterized protein n=1 Tax=Parelaphostrongylus tenuis TaxID=148309 RepID=A0AAD5QUD3_PARTN|nr:hypothetical protein KIN20_025354 [Parelaphostrongylus tenuis]
MAGRENQMNRSASPIPDDPAPLSSSGTEPVQEGNPRGQQLQPEYYTYLGVDVLPWHIAGTFAQELVAGKYYAKSSTRQLGPFDREPTENELPSGDSYCIMKILSRIGANGSYLFRHVKHISTSAERSPPPPRPTSPSTLPGLRGVNLDIATMNNLVPGQYYARSVRRLLGPFSQCSATA